MRYCGSKQKFAKDIIPIITKDLGDKTFIDLFSGGCNIISEVDTPNKVAVDINKYVINMWKRIANNGIDFIPSMLSKDEYEQIKLSYINKDGKYDDSIIGYVANSCSFSSSWFNGYSGITQRKNGKTEDHIAEAYRNIEKQVKNFKYLKETSFYYNDYELFMMQHPEYKGDNCVLYCDIPYFSTKKYMTDFDHENFYEFVRDLTKEGYIIYVSEYEMPDDFVCIWSKEKKDGCGTCKDGCKQKVKVEKLFVHKDCKILQDENRNR